MDLGLAGKIALVSGGTRGLGLAVALTLQAEGARVMVTSRATPEGFGRGPTAGLEHLVADLVAPDAPERVVRETAARLGGLDLLVNNAAGFDEVGLLDPSRSQWLELFERELLGYHAMIQAAVPHLVARSPSAIVNVAGIAALRPMSHAPHASAVNAAVLTLTRVWARELAPRGVRVNAVTPASVRTDRFAARVERLVRAGGGDPAEVERTLMADFPTAEAIEPGEVASLIAMVCSPRLRSLVGANVVMDGGLTA